MFMQINALILKIEQELDHRGWAKSEFCERLNISTQTYNNWRSRGVPSRRLGDIATLFNWDVGKLLIRGEVRIMEEPAHYSTLSPDAEDLARRWQTLPRHLQQHVLEVLESTEQIAKTKPKK